MRNSARKCIEISFKTEGVFAFFWSVFRIFFCWRRFFSEKRAFVLALSRWIFAGLSHYFQINPDLGLGPTVHFLSRFFQKAGDFFRKWHISFQNAALTDIKNEPKTHQKHAPLLFKKWVGKSTKIGAFPLWKCARFSFEIGAHFDYYLKSF